ncbi:MOSC domain-containing protein [Micromonospora zamorensis]|uniref:MOSC domain-containing protein n=1 Tax=Micromonospora zamorensis TaxID=709883 RepID=UPI0033DBFC26
MSSVVMLRRYPLKSAQGEALTAVEVEPTGLRGDRTWACIDRLDGTVGSAKHPRRWGRLCGVAATTDFGAVHIVTTGALDLLGQRIGGASVAAARFRPNLVIDAPGDPEPGQELHLGDVVLRVTLPTPRCVIPGLPQADLPADRSVLSALARHYRVPVAGLGHAACFGTYADVVQPGRLRLGQRVR